MIQDEKTLAAAIAVTRFGLGARPGEIEAVSDDPVGWLHGQIRPSGAPRPAGDLPDGEARMKAFVAYQIEQRTSKDDPENEAAGGAVVQSRRALSQGTMAEFLARAELGAMTPDGFAERWALFWSNALTVSAVKFVSATFVGQYEREAIRPNVFGRFEDMVVAAERHPAMLLYLDQAQSIGPASLLGSRRDRAGLNENLAREILELHTVGADAGYSQADVTELARALSGWSVPTPRDRQTALRTSARARAMFAVEPGPHGFAWRPGVHEPGVRTVMGRRYDQEGLAQAEAILHDLARHPATARRLARRIAVHFVADDPPAALVDRLEAAWTGSQGDLAVVARALIDAPEAWDPAPAKIKTPYEFVVSAHRALGVPPARVQALRQALTAMGQPAFAPPSPEGWPDSAADWAGPDALVKRLNWARTAAARAGAADPNSVAVDALGLRMGDRTRTAVARAESRPEALTLFLMSPEFQRR